MVLNEFEDRARMAKAQKLANKLEEHALTSEEVKELTEEEWRHYSVMVNQKMPSELTRQKVVEVMLHRELNRKLSRP